MRGGLQKQQTGAVTMIGALLLITTMMVLLTAIQRMSGSGISDSAYLNDGIEALFIAESGLERVAWRYSNNNNCAALTSESGTVGRGSFSVLSAVMVGSDCQVRVSGKVQTTSTENSVKRTIEVNLSAAGSSEIKAVGKRNNGELIIKRDGNSWSRSGPYPNIPNTDLNDISCVSATDCWAVGKSKLTIHWDGSTWTQASASWFSLFNTHISSVHCVSSDNCWAVGSRELIIHWNGNRWNLASSWLNIFNPDLYSVHCTSKDNCWAVGARDNRGELILKWNGNYWMRAGPYGNIPNGNLYSVHCTSNNDCWAVGARNGNSELIIHFDGNKWTRSGPFPSVANVDLYGIHCSGTNDCWAVGAKSSYENINHWDGNSWSRMASSSSISNRNLRGVYAVSPTEAYLVGQAGTTAIWDGNNWTGQPSMTNSDLLAVTAATANDGVEIVRWREVIQ